MEEPISAAEVAGPSPREHPVPGSPAFSIAAVKGSGASRRSTYDLQAWPAELQGASVGRRTTGGSTASDASAAEGPPLARLPAWRRAWNRLTAAADVAVQVAARALPAPSSQAAALLTPRSHSLEVLALGREQSAPYLPGKRSMPRHGMGSTHQDVEAPAPAPVPPKQGGRALAMLRWRRACQAVMDGRQVLRCLDLLGNRLAAPDDRLHAAFWLRMRLDPYGPHPEQLACSLAARPGLGRLSSGDHVLNELYITGEQIFTFFVPPAMGQHWPYATSLLLGVLVLLYFFMAGQYGQYQAVTAPATTACLAALRRNGTSSVWGPSGMVRWIAPRKSVWCYPGDPGKFDAAFLIDWGARYAPLMRSSPQRWLTSTLLHQSFMHVLSNCLMLGGFAWHMEAKHGSWRVMLLFVLSGLGGNLLSAVTEAPCVAVVGASGIVFGAAACNVADMLHNFETLRRPLLRTACMLAFLVFFSVTVGTTPTGTSHMSHVGGFLSGLLVALVVLRNPHRSRAELALTVLGILGCVAMYAALPCIFYLRQLPSVRC